MTGHIIPADDFRGDNAKLIACIGALLSMDADGALVPHGIGGHARSLLAAAAARIPAETAPAIDLEQFRGGVEAEFELACADLIGELITAEQHQDAEAKRTRLLALIDGSKAGTLNEPFGNSEELLQATEIAASAGEVQP